MSVRTLSLRLISVFVMLSLGLAGCAAAKSQTPQPFPDGTYTAPDPRSGTLELNLTQGNFTMNLNDNSVVNLVTAGKYSMDGDKITFTEQKTSIISACLKKDSAYTYQYAWNTGDNALSFKVVKDGCVIRSAANTATPWKYVH